MKTNEINTQHVDTSIEELVDNLTLFDDDLMSIVFDGNIPATELILKTILERNDIKVLNVVGQKELKNPVVGGRNIRLDILAVDEQGEQFNVEVQRKNSGADERRARFHSSMVDSRMLLRNQDFKEEGGRSMVCEAVEEYAKRKADEVAKEVAKEVARKVAIKETIRSGIAYGVDKDNIVTRLHTEFDVTEEEAETLYNTYAKSIA